MLSKKRIYFDLLNSYFAIICIYSNSFLLNLAEKLSIYFNISMTPQKSAIQHIPIIHLYNHIRHSNAHSRIQMPSKKRLYFTIFHNIFITFYNFSIFQWLIFANPLITARVTNSTYTYHSLIPPHQSLICTLAHVNM